MNVKTFKARTLADALRLVRDEFGPEARVLSTKDSKTIWSRLTGTQHVEVTALDYDVDQAPRVECLVESVAAAGSNESPKENSMDGAVIGTMETQLPDPVAEEESLPLTSTPPLDAGPRFDYRNQLKQFAEMDARQNSEADESSEGSEPNGVFESVLESMTDSVQQVDRFALPDAAPKKVPNAVFQFFSDLIEADVDEELAKQIIDELQRHASPAQLEDVGYLRKRASEWISGKVTVSPEIRAYPGQRRVVALIGPTGVGKTTTIAKLAANLRLRDKRRVGLITVDTYRIAAVDQLQAYADIIDLPMEVVTTPREMRNAVNRLSGVEIVLIDTAGRSPRDEIQLQELKSMLSEARPDEVHLVLSSASSGRHLTRLVEQFTPVSPTSLVLTKLDESMTYGHLLPVACSGKLPLSYTTHGQNVPDDIQPASASTIVESVI